MTTVLAEWLFCTLAVSFVVLIYQSAILPGIRQELRFKLFTLRDDLRSLVIAGQLRENDEAFVLLHERLNFMSSNLPRFDLFNAVRVVRQMPREELDRIESCTQVISNSLPEVNRIFRSSLEITLRAIVFNSVFFFLVGGLILALTTLLRVGIVRLKNALVQYANEKGKIVFFEAPQVAV